VSAALAAESARWRFVAFHTPIYSNGRHGSDYDYREYIEPTLAGGRVHAVFSGHDHNYQRSIPVHGVTYLVSGGAGGTRAGQRSPIPKWQASFAKETHFLSVTVTADKAVIKAWRPVNDKGPAFEEFESCEIPVDCGWSSPETVIATSKRRTKLGWIGWAAAGAVLAAALGAIALRRARRRRT